MAHYVNTPFWIPAGNLNDLECPIQLKVRMSNGLLAGSVDTSLASLLCSCTRKPCYRKEDRAMRPMYTYKLFTLILFTLTVTILCADFDSERI